LSRGFFRVFGRVKIAVLLGFSIAAYNVDRIRSFRAKQTELDRAPRTRAKRRQGIWDCVAALDGVDAPDGPDDAFADTS
jgi:hypothetical protein